MGRDREDVSTGKGLMKILFVDTETTGLSPEQDRVVEIGASLYCALTQRLIRSICFITTDDTVKISPEISKINHITQEMLEKYGVNYKSVFSLLRDNFVSHCDFLCAHNAPFDRSFLEAELKRAGMDNWDRPWIDTSVDLPFASSITTRKLTHLAAEHGFLNPFPHTALSDVLTMYRVFSNYKIADIVKRQSSPNLTITAMVDYATREKAAKRGFRWNPDKKRWLKIIKEVELEYEKAKCDFEIMVVSS